MSARRRSQAGSVTAFVAAFAVALVAVAGLVVDGGYLLAGRSAALDEAEAAARAGAQAVDVGVLRLGGPVAIREDDARRGSRPTSPAPGTRVMWRWTATRCGSMSVCPCG